jgi:hypothetical protein
MSGLSFRVMIVRAFSAVTVVLSGIVGASSDVQPSSKASFDRLSKRPEAFDWAPRPCDEVAMRAIHGWVARPIEQNKNRSRRRAF